MKDLKATLKNTVEVIKLKRGKKKKKGRKRNKIFLLESTVLGPRIIIRIDKYRNG